MSGRTRCHTCWNFDEFCTCRPGVPDAPGHPVDATEPRETFWTTAIDTGAAREITLEDIQRWVDQADYEAAHPELDPPIEVSAEYYKQHGPQDDGWTRDEG